MITETINLTHGEIEVNLDLFDRKLDSVYGGQQLIYRYFVTTVGNFGEITLVVSARVLSEDTGRIELEFFDAEPLDDKNEILESGTTHGEMVDELVNNHEFLEALTEAFQR